MLRDNFKTVIFEICFVYLAMMFSPRNGIISGHSSRPIDMELPELLAHDSR